MKQSLCSLLYKPLLILPLWTNINKLLYTVSNSIVYEDPENVWFAFVMKCFKVSFFILTTGLCFLPACFPRLYILVSQAKDWSSAKQFCRNKYTDLACVHNEKDLAMVNKLTKGLLSVWIGLQPDTEAWRWSLEYQNYYVEGGAEFRMWASNEPNVGPGYYKACVAMLPSGEWADQACSVTYPFICYYKSNEKQLCRY